MTMPTPEESKQFVAHIFDRAVDTYEAVDAEFFTPLGIRLVERAELNAGDHVLDLGTGRGAALIPASKAVGPSGHVDGIDLASNMVEATSNDLQRLGITNATVHVGDAEQPPGIDGGYDAILAALLVFFLPDGRGALRTWHGLLKPGGRFAYTTFAFGDERWLDVFDTFTPFLPGEMTASQVPLEGWYASDDGNALALTEAGFSGITSISEAIEMRFRDPQHWFDFTRSNGGLMLWDAVPSDEVAQVEAVLAAKLEPLREPDGTISLITGIRFTTATA